MQTLLCVYARQVLERPRSHVGAPGEALNLQRLKKTFEVPCLCAALSIPSSKAPDEQFSPAL